MNLQALDLDDFDDVTEATLIIRHPETGAPTNASITLASREHIARKSIELARARRMRAEMQRTGKMPTIDPEEEREEETDYLVAATLGWDMRQGGNGLKFSPAAARSLYEDPKKQWLRQQVLQALNKTELFIKASAKP